MCTHSMHADWRSRMHIHCREAEFLLKLNHDSIVQCYDVMDNGKQMVLVMEYLRGGPLLDDLHHIAGESYTEQQASVIAAQVQSRSSCSCTRGGGLGLHHACVHVCQAYDNYESSDMQTAC